MGNSFFQMQCLSEKEINRDDIYESLFDKKVDKKYLDGAVQKFANLNREMFSFVGVTMKDSGVGSDLSIKFTTSGYVGAIPLKMPHDGMVHKDFQITPRFDSSEDVFSDLTQLLSKLEYVIAPEYNYGEKLVNPLQLRPPMYYEAAKFIDLFERTQKQNWVKFDVVKAIHNYPKSNTDWAKYSLRSVDPQKALEYHSSDSILSLNHKEWQNLKYVFTLAKDVLSQTNVPAILRYKYLSQLVMLEKKTSTIKPLVTKEIPIHAFDPQIIKETKKQANTLLKDSITSCVAWRIDMAQLFERYVQYIVSTSLRSFGASVMPNNKIRGNGQMPQWGLKYLEPDIMINFKSTIYMADAKYKANFYASGESDILKETHRHDLHQLLAYCSFSPDRDKTGFLFYPSNQPKHKKLSYVEPLCGITNNVYLCGIPFGTQGIDDSVASIKEIFEEFID